MTRRIPCVGAVVHDADGRIVLVLRAHPPAAGSWSLPGGRIEPGETATAAVIREVAEETGLRVEVSRLIGTVERDAGHDAMYVIDDYECTVTGGRLRPGDDAADVRWCTPDEVRSLPTAPELVETLESWGVLPRREGSG